MSKRNRDGKAMGTRRLVKFINNKDGGSVEKFDRTLDDDRVVPNVAQISKLGNGDQPITCHGSCESASNQDPDSGRSQSFQVF